MAEPSKTTGSIRFGPFDLSLETEELRKNGIRLKLSGQAIQVLVFLATRPGELVTREELQRKLWPGESFGDFEHGLNAAVNRLRETLGDSATEPIYIETVPRRGYRFVANGRTPPEPPLPRPRAWVRIAVAALVMLAVGRAAFWLLRPPSPPPPTPRQPVPLNALPGNAMPGSFSPDGQQLVFSWDKNDHDKASWDVFVQSLGTEQPLQITHHAGSWMAPSWSPDGKSIAFVYQRKLGGAFEIVLIPAIGGHEVVLGRASPFPKPDQPAWSPDSKYVAFTDLTKPDGQSALYLLRLADLQRTQLTFPPQGTDGDATPVFSPDGKEIAFSRALSDGVEQVAVLAVASGDVRVVSSELGTTEGLAWDENGREIIYSSNKSGVYQLWRVPAKGGNAKRADIGEDAQVPIISARAHRLAYTRAFTDNNIWRVQLNENGGDEKRAELMASTRADNQPQLSHDNTKAAFISDRSGAPEVWVSNADGSDPAQLTHMETISTGTPSWSPDGRHLAFDSRLRGHADIYIVGLDGATPRRVTDDGFDDSVPSWSADGKWIYYTSMATGSRQVWKVPVDGGQPVQVTRQGGQIAVEGADGATLYYLKDNLWQKRLPDGEERRFSEVTVGTWNGWQVTRKGIYFVSPLGAPPTGWPRQGQALLRYFDFATKATTAVTTISLALPGGIAVSSDGRTVLYTQTDSAGSEIMLVENFH